MPQPDDDRVIALRVNRFQIGRGALLGPNERGHSGMEQAMAFTFFVQGRSRPIRVSMNLEEVAIFLTAAGGTLKTARERGATE